MNFVEDKFMNISGKIYSTTDYSLFRTLEGNRSVSDGRIKKIISSINAVGYIQSPIVVNENMEVIDGQGRLAALKKLKMPIEYVVSPGAGIKECISMNINAENWKMGDYIDSFADRGYDSYIRLRDLMTSYKVPLDVIATATFNISKFHANTIKGGNLDLDHDAALLAECRLSKMLSIFSQIDTKYIKNSKTMLQQAILYVLSFDEVDYKRLCKALTEYLDIPRTGWSSIEIVIEDIESAYNKGLSNDKCVMIYNIYRELMRKNGLRGVLRNNGKISSDE